MKIAWSVKSGYPACTLPIYFFTLREDSTALFSPEGVKRSLMNSNEMSQSNDVQTMPLAA